MSASASVARTSGLSEARTLAPLRDPDRLDRSRGTGTGGVTADRIGFSREISLPQRRQAERQSGLQGVANSVGSTFVRGGQAAETIYGRDGRLVGATGFAVGERQTNQSTRNAQVAVPTTGTVPSGTATVREAGPQSTQGVASPAAADRASVTSPRVVAERQVEARTDSATQTVVQNESRQQQRSERSEAAARLAQRLGEVQNTERPRPAQEQNDVARQRLERAYLPVPMAAAARVSVFA